MTTMSILNPAYRRDNLAPFYVLDDIFTHEELDRILAYCKEAGTEKAVVARARAWCSGRWGRSSVSRPASDAPVQMR